MKVTALRETLQRLEDQGLGDSSLWVYPGQDVLEVSHRAGDGIVVGFDLGDYPIERVNATFTQPEDADVILLEFGVLNRRPIGDGTRPASASPNGRPIEPETAL